MKKMLIAGVVTSILLAGCVSNHPSSVNHNQDVTAGKTSENPLDDSGITARVKAAFIDEKLFGNKPISAITISVETINRVVYLTGSADNSREIHNAIHIAKSVSGVRRVVSHVKISRS